MSRVFVLYGGQEYMISGRTADDVCDEILQRLATGTPSWLDVTTGAGRYQETRLLIQPGVDVAGQDIDEGARGQHADELTGAIRLPFVPLTADPAG